MKVADTVYQQARKLGLKEVKARTARQEDPYIPALEQMLPHMNAMAEEKLGDLRLDIDQVVGTRSQARQKTFSASFFPLLEDSSEFAAKWSALAEAHIKEGIWEPIIAVEYLNRFYVVEGHKRVSVLRFFGAPTVRAQVTRLLPPRSDEPEIRLYYEFLDFYRVTKINYLRFDQPGSYTALLKLLSAEPGPWDEDRQRLFYSDVCRFRQAFRSSELRVRLTRDQALLRYLKIFGCEHLRSRTPGELVAELTVIAPELMDEAGETGPILMTDAPDGASRSILKRIVSPSVRSVKAAFLHDKSPENSFWTYAHEQGRLAVQAELGDRVKTVSCFNVLGENVAERIDALAAEGYDMVFTTTPRLLHQTVTAAGAHPEVRFLNCSLNVNHPIIRCYYARMYEAKFLTGLIAGSVCENGRIGYICNYPVYSMPAAINAFALGAKMVNSRARICLKWTTVTDEAVDDSLSRDDVTAISGLDSFVPSGGEQDLGIFVYRDGRRQKMAYSYWDWGQFYKKILTSVLDGSWTELNTASESGKTINYWWGLAEGAVDVSLCPELPYQTARLVKLLRQEIAEGNFRPFDGPVYDQSGLLRIAPGEKLTPDSILHMDWLTDNVEGEIPAIGRLVPEARELVKLQGVKEDEKEE